MATEIRIPEATVDLHVVRTVAVALIPVGALIVTIVNTVLDHVRGPVRIANRGTRLDRSPSPGLILVVIEAVHEVPGMEANDELPVTIIRSLTDAWAFLDSAFTRPNVKFVIYSRNMEILKASK